MLLETIICCCKPFLFRTLFLPGKHSLWQDRHSGSTFADIKGEVGSRGGAMSAAGGTGNLGGALFIKPVTTRTGFEM